MALIKSLLGKDPHIAESCFLAETAVIIGDVFLSAHASIWYNAVLRGDVNSIHIGEASNVQDNVTIHGTYQKAKTVIKNRVTIGHNAVIHGCTIEDHVLIGMGAVIMDHAHIKSYSIIAAGSVVLPHTVVEERSVYAGIPAKKVKDVSDHQMAAILKNAEHYLLYKQWYS